MKATALAVLALGLAGCSQQAASAPPPPYVYGPPPPVLVLSTPDFGANTPPPVFISTPRGNMMCTQNFGNINCF